METDPETGPSGFPREALKHWIGVSAEDIPPGWMDDMVKRLFEQLNRELIRAERASTHAPEAKDAGNKVVDDPDAREKNARILTRLQTQLEKLTKMEMERAALRATKSARKPSAARAELARKLARAAEPGAPGPLSGKPE